MDQRLALLLALLDQGYERRAWHGPNLRGSIRGLSAQEAAWRPSHGRHSIAEQVLHAAYWKYTVRRRINGEKRGSFDLEGSNWFPVDETAYTEKNWKNDLLLLNSVHQSLREAISAIDPSRLDSIPPGGKVSFQELIQGIAMHDVYHAGQISLLKRLRLSMSA